MGLDVVVSMNNHTITYKLAELITNTTINKLSDNIVNSARMAVIDTLGIGIAGYKLSELPSKIANQICFDGGNSTLFNLYNKGKPILVAFINALASHSIEYDDWIPEAYVHPGCVVVPTALSIAEDMNRRWIDVLEAIIVGYEVMARVGAMLGRKHYNKFHTTGTAGIFGAVATASKLLSLKKDEILNSFGIAGSFTSALWEFIKVGSYVKPLSPAYAVFKGILAVYLALQGYRGPSTIFEGDAGILRSFHSDMILKYIDTPMWESAILKNNFKPYPTCRHTHSAIDAAIILRSKIENIDKIKKVVVEVYDEAAKISGITKPKNLDEARFSLSYCVSAALFYGKLGYGELIEALNNKKVNELQDKIKVIVNKRYSIMYPKKQYSKVIVHTTSNIILSEAIDNPRGSVEKPLTLDNIIEKISNLRDYAKIRLDIKRLIHYLTSKVDDEVDLIKLKY